MRMRVGVAALVLLGLSGVALADKKSDAEAKQFYLEGTKYYNLGNFKLAVENYTKAYEKKPDPVFLYNIAQSYRLANDFGQALFFYKSFLRNLPDPPNRTEVERRITEMEETIARQKAATAPPNDTVAPTETPPTETPTETPDEGDTKVPPVEDVGDASDVGQENQTAPTGPVDTGGGKKPIYKKWWFWAGIGAVAVGTVAIIAVSAGGSASAPDSHFGTTEVF